MVSTGKKVTKDFSKLNIYEVSQRGKKVAIIGLEVENLVIKIWVRKFLINFMN